MRTCDCAIVRALREPDRLDQFSMAEWDTLIRQGRRADLLARLHGLVQEKNLLASLPEAPRAHLQAARVVADKQATAVAWEVRKIRAAIAHTGAPLILLKGAAYCMAALAAGRGRVFSDVDILVPRQRINHVEAALMLHGWVATQHDAYDQRYYRTWMHEIPPLLHIRRLSVIDVHHAILPETARLRPDPALLLAAAQPIADEPGVYTLAPADMVLHSASHLFCGEFGHGLRDLSDIDLLLREFGTVAGFWDGLVARAQSLDLARPLYYALHWATRLFATPVPPIVLREIDACARPSTPVKTLMNALLQRTLAPDHASCRDALSVPARALLYARAHWLRMPPHLLAYHLAHKALFPPRAATN
ncbi:nucleotidyltransferase domain-containing protein [Sulfuriferula plumbiphila]|nr:nucleotidyltransferase family protein [Sulfuriferula plumbiphila]